ncbi:MerR family transcriptional regulator [Olleya aquimaris]|uniref:MerR family transcriptional regulator n=1 Tax=Olleya sediminilitoris TaxID=2795739 RepID=A0ABS1WKY0_9FLAO|nr:MULTISPECIES: MerR family transcriptional regulator [Olleya]AXO81677.1 MerR family transcriptional regulator [Olleya aquimaris]MBL7559779.1 MerR family transcriptional regulator [Olleya sediminilitoris]
MNNIKSKFSIKDLENLSGIKAHTIRIWEKRYNLFQPNRTDTNIRYYSLASLQKILNISYLNKNGYKISKIAKLDTEDIPKLVKEIADKNDKNNHSINALKLAMINFDQGLFYKTYSDLITNHSFETIFNQVFVPLLDDIGLLWQTDTITPAHEHFIVELIKQKIILNTEKAINTTSLSNQTEAYVLFLPDNEVHELGLLFTNYSIINKGAHAIYLGQSVPIDSLQFLNSQYDKIIFISCFTVKPEKDNLNDYLEEFYKKILHKTDNTLVISGRMSSLINNDDFNQIKAYKSTKEVIENL